MAGQKQERTSGAQEQGRDRGGSAMLRNSMSEPTYFQRSSIADPEYTPSMGRPRGMVTPQVNVAEGARQQPCAWHAREPTPVPAVPSRLENGLGAVGAPSQWPSESRYHVRRAA